VAVVAHRLTPFENSIPLQLDSRVSFDLPKGYHCVEKENPADKLDSRFVTFESDRLLKDGKLELTFKCHQAVGRYNASEYSSYQGTMAQVLSAMDSEVVLQKD
jgi:hypothetical protein